MMYPRFVRLMVDPDGNPERSIAEVVLFADVTTTPAATVKLTVTGEPGAPSAVNKLKFVTLAVIVMFEVDVVLPIAAKWPTIHLPIAALYRIKNRSIPFGPELNVGATVF